MVKKVFLRRVDENLYREAKARASLLGVPVSEVINMALREWLAKPLEVEEKEERSPLVKKARELALKYSREGRKGVLLVINDGEEHFLFNSYEEAISKLRDLYRRNAVKNSILKEVPPKKRFIEAGGGFVQVQRKL